MRISPLIALLTLLFPSALRAEIVEFDDFKFAMDIPSGWSWDTTTRHYPDEITVLNAVNKDYNKYISVMVTPAVGSAHDPDPLANFFLSYLSDNAVPILDSFHMVMGGLNTLHAYTSYPNDQAQGDMMAAHIVFGAAHGYGYILVSSYRDDRPERDEELSGIITSFALTEIDDGTKEYQVIDLPPAAPPDTSDIIDYVKIAAVIIALIIMLVAWLIHRSKRERRMIDQDDEWGEWDDDDDSPARA